MKSKAPIHYSITPFKPEAHLFKVSLQVLQPAEEQLLRMPAWIPGSYMIRDFAKNIVQIKAKNADGQTLSLEKLDKSTWKLCTQKQAITVEYEVYAWDCSVRAAWLDASRAYFNGTSVFLEVVGQGDQAVTLDIHPPPRGDFQSWKVGTTLPRLETARYSFGRYHAADYDELIDHPVEISAFDSVVFDVEGVRHEMIISGYHTANMERLASDLKRICAEHIAFFDGDFPASEYLFMTYATKDGYGGLEHRASTSLMCARADFPVENDQDISSDYLNFLTLCSHEYFHTWNVKGMKPAVFQPFDLSKEIHTELLWVFEGCTVYYECLPLLRCGLITVEQYLQYVGEQFSRVMRSSGRLKQSLAESSFDTWTKFYKKDENAPNAIASYYTRGAMVAMALDLMIRNQTRDELSLDHVMLAMWRQYRKTGEGLAERGFERLIQDVTGVDVSQLVEDWVYGRAIPPLNELLSEFGIEYQLRSSENNRDKGGTIKHVPERVALSALVGRNGKGDAVLKQVWDQGAAMQAGLSAGDVIIALNDLKVNADTIEKQVAALPLGQMATVFYFRDDRLMSALMPGLPGQADRVVLIQSDQKDLKQLEKRKQWLKVA